MSPPILRQLMAATALKTKLLAARRRFGAGANALPVRNQTARHGVSTSTPEAAGVRAGETGRRNRRPNKRYAGPEWYT
jgi:hypothetical protein